MGESILEDDPAILGLRVDQNDNRDEQQGTYTNSAYKRNNDDAEDDVDVQKNKSKEQLTMPDLSWFEVNVIQNEFEAEFIVDVCRKAEIN